jgi:Ca2+-binding EF-hand superfamily protein
VFLFKRDGNGLLEFGEFLIAYAATSNSQPLKKLEFIFKFYDSDRVSYKYEINFFKIIKPRFYITSKDGKLTDKEFLLALERLYAFRKKDRREYSPEECVKDLFLRIDENGDRKLTKQEFIDGCLKNQKLVDLLSPFEIC